MQPENPRGGRLVSFPSGVSTTAIETDLVSIAAAAQSRQIVGEIQRNDVGTLSIAKNGDGGPIAERGYTASMTISYALEPGLSPAEFVDVLVRSTLAERRPVDRPGEIRSMLDHAGIIVTARAERLLVGVSRGITDFAYCTYLSDLAVDEAYQRRGIGRELIRRTHEAAGLHTHLVLLAAPKARSYYPHIGMEQHDSCWVIRRRTD